ncbi:MAG TPA: two-component regulator propeller domain-containing protein, partial [Balneolaceae bacterium]|nr:two-component regulator propeller domain-containing protein [Balneolaceae bacterium]
NYFVRDKQKFVHFFHKADDPKSLSSNYINCLYIDNEGNLWIGTKKGLDLWNPGSETFTHYLHDPANSSSISGNDVMTIYEDKRGNLWVGTESGLNRMNRKTGTFHHYLHKPGDPHSISGNSIFSILQDSHGVLWIGTQNHGLDTFDYKTDRFYHYKHQQGNSQSLSNNSVNSIYENRDRVLFFGTYSGGINYVDRKKPEFKWYKYNSHSDHPLSNNSVTAFLKDNDGNIWVGTDGGGLDRFNPKTGNFYPMRHEPHNKNSLSSNVVLALLNGHKHNIWIGYYHGGISKYNEKTKTFTNYKHIDGDSTSLSNNDVFVLYRDREGHIWAGTNGGGVSRFNPQTQTFTNYQVQEGVVRDIYEDTRGNFWVAEYGGGLKLLNRKTGKVWNFYEGDHGLHSNVILSLYESKKHKFWLGTKEAGLNLFNRDSLKFTSYTRKDGLPSNQVKGILGDDHGNLWLSTTNGISEFNPRTKKIRNFNKADGLKAKEFNTLAYYKDRKGYMYFGSINGFTRFNPDSIKINKYVHPLAFTGFKIFNKAVAVGNKSPLKKQISQVHKIVLPHTASVLTFKYASLNFSPVKGVKYAYKLEGFDQHWNYVGKKRTATYTNLDPGTYTLRVKAANNDGVWSKHGIALKLVIIPPFWQTTWFYILSGLLTIGVIIGLYKLRVRSIRRRNKRLKKEVASRTEELYSKNEALQDALKNLRSMRSELLEKAHKAGMADVATGVLHNVGNILTSVNISTSFIKETIEDSKISNFKKANALLNGHRDNLEDFLLNDPRGEKLLDYYDKLEDALTEEYKRIKKHSERLSQKIQLITDVIDEQQDFAKVKRIKEQVHLENIVRDILKLQSASFERHGLSIIKDFDATPKVTVQRSKLMHILVNLIKNARESMSDMDENDKKIIIRTFQDEDHICISINDNGSGIPEGKIDKIFNAGFTTKREGHGYGLHTCANYMKEMGGYITVSNDGPLQGAHFRLCFERDASPKEER